MTLKHPFGRDISTEGKLPIDAKENKSEIQSVSSIAPYTRRYLLDTLMA